MSGGRDAGFVGLCSTCANAKTCAFRRKRGFDAVFCEMFDPIDPEVEAVAAGSNAVGGDTGTDVSRSEDGLERTKGLCMNCAHRDHCALPYPEGGVWHCEEYE